MHAVCERRFQMHRVDVVVSLRVRESNPARSSSPMRRWMVRSLTPSSLAIFEILARGSRATRSSTPASCVSSGGRVTSGAANEVRVRSIITGNRGELGRVVPPVTVHRRELRLEACLPLGRSRRRLSWTGCGRLAWCGARFRNRARSGSDFYGDVASSAVILRNGRSDERSIRREP